MFKKIASTILLGFITLLFFSSCKNDNKGYREYYHSMGNNPVQVVPWLRSIKKSFYGNEGRISLYELDEKEYYTTQVFYQTEELPISPYTIYERNDLEKIVYFHTDDALASDQDSIYIHFIENATPVLVLWSNEKKYSTFE